MNSACFLLVEDSEEDILLIRRSFARGRILNPLQVVRGGEQAIAYLEGKDQFADRNQFPMPALILLDLRMPGTDGFAVLSWLKQHPELDFLRVVVLSSSDSMRDVSAAYALGAKSFLIKPLDFERFVEFSAALSGCWCWLESAPGNPPVPLAPSDTEFFRRIKGASR